MDPLTLVPFCLETNNVIQPKFIGELNGKYIFNLYSPFNGRELKESTKVFSIGVEIIVPLGVVSFFKQIHYEENGTYTKDERYDRGLVPLLEGKRYKLNFSIPEKMNRKSLVRGELIGSLIFMKKVELVRFWPTVHLNNLIRFKRLRGNAYKPLQLEGSAGIDLPSACNYELLPNEKIRVQTGLAFQIPQGFYGRILCRSGIADSFGVDVLGGVIDNSYRGEIYVILQNHGSQTFRIQAGDRIAQMVITPLTKCVLIECDLDQTTRGDKGLGSSGLKKDSFWNSAPKKSARSLSLSFEDLVGTDSVSMGLEKSVCEDEQNPLNLNLFD